MAFTIYRGNSQPARIPGQSIPGMKVWGRRWSGSDRWSGKIHARCRPARNIKYMLSWRYGRNEPLLLDMLTIHINLVLKLSSIVGNTTENHLLVRAMLFYYRKSSKLLHFVCTSKSYITMSCVQWFRTSVEPRIRICLPLPRQHISRFVSDSTGVKNW